MTKTFSKLLEELEKDILALLKDLGAKDVNVEDEYVVANLDRSEQVTKALSDLPDDIDFEIVVYDKDGEEVDGLDDIDDEEDADAVLTDLDDTKHTYQIIVYLYNTESEEQMDEVKRKIRINSKGSRRIKMKCNQGYKWTGTKCQKISGTELINKRKAIRKAVRTKRAKGTGATRRANILRKRAMQKRKSFGLRNKR